MGWMESIREAIRFMEDNIKNDLTVEQIARQVSLSPFYFQKGFAMLCGFTVGDYIRRRRLALAGIELVSSDEKIIDIALRYGYESPDSFTKAFTRFHGATPTAVRKEGAMIKSFAPLSIEFSLKGGLSMEYKITEKDAFTVMGVSRMFQYDSAFEAIPKFWDETKVGEQGSSVCGVYGISIDESMDGGEFEYLVADDYIPWKDVPAGCITKVIPKHTWAVFPIKGGLPKSLQEMQTKIFSEWLPSCSEYEIAAGYNVELYSDIREYPRGLQDESYYCEIWIPVRKK